MIHVNDVSRKILGERVVLLGWGRAILLQLAHPLVAAGVRDHSTFRASRRARLLRLHQTVQAMLALTFGPDPEARAAAGRINTIHDRVKGTLKADAGAFGAGTPYSAHDPQLLRWVHATLLDSLPMAYELFVGPLTVEEKERYCVESRAMGPRLGITEEELPGGTGELNAYLQRMLASGDIAVTDASRELAQEILHPPFGTALWPLARLNRLATIGLLPAQVRAGYRLPWSERDERALHRQARLVRRARHVLPPILAHWAAARH